MRALLATLLVLGLAPGCSDSAKKAADTGAPVQAADKPDAAPADPLEGIEEQLGLGAGGEPPPEVGGGDERGGDFAKPAEAKTKADANSAANSALPVYGPAGYTADGDPLRSYRGKRHVVDAAGGGDFLSIAAALATAAANDVIEVRPGTYREPLKLTRPVAIVGKGDRQAIIVEVSGANVVASDAVRALLMGLTLRQSGGEPARYAVDVSDGRLEVRACDVQSASLAAVAVHKKGVVALVASRLHDSRQSGLFAYDGGRAEVTASDITGNGAAGIEVKGTGKATITGSDLHDGGASGLFVHAGGQATLERSKVARNRLAGVEIKSGGRATLEENLIADGEQSGVFINEGGGGLLDGNTVRANALAGLELKSGADPIVRGNNFVDGKQSGIFVNEGALGTIEDNRVTGNGLAGIEVKGGTASLMRNTVADNAQSGIYIHRGGGGVASGNTVRRNGKSGFEINTGARPTVTENQIEHNGGFGIWILPEGGGTFSGNSLANNTRGPVRIDGEAAAQVQGDLPTPKAVEPTPTPPPTPKLSPYDPKIEPPK